MYNQPCGREVACQRDGMGWVACKCGLVASGRQQSRIIESDA
jgi:hypothetical protein